MICLLGLALFNHSNAQGLEHGNGLSSNASQCYFELGGPGIIYSFNYDGRFGKYENGIGFRIGMGGATVNGSGYIAIPFQLNYLAGSRGKYLELGAGATYAPNLDLFYDGDPQSQKVNTYGTLLIGFRKQPFGAGGFTFRAGFSPIFSFANGGSFVPFGYVSWGFRF